MKEYLCSTYFIDSEHPLIMEFAEKYCRGGETDKEKAIDIYYAVRDGIRYNPYRIEIPKESMKASTILSRGDGYCVAKAVVLGACLRSQGIPARLGFADVRNHLVTQRLKELMGTDLFVYHGFTEIFLNGNWIKATPAFNLSLCDKFNVKALDFDGENDSVFQPYDNAGNTHMEYIKTRGSFADLPWDTIISEFIKEYPLYYKSQGDFYAEAGMENKKMVND
jgi:transglutaminase-like putative cysteine protease